MQTDGYARLPMRPRIIPVLLVADGLLYKTVRFKDRQYVGDPRVAVKIFSDKGADELILLDIERTKLGGPPDYDLIEEIAGESFMPVAYGGGIRSAEQAREVVARGVEKVVLNSHAFLPGVIESISAELGASGVVVSIDIRRRWLGGYQHVTHNAKRPSGMGPEEAARTARDRGAGEIMVTSVEQDGTMQGYDNELIRRVASAVDIPVIACGGAGKLEHFPVATRAGASAAAAGSMFVFQGVHRAVLITFPPEDALNDLFRDHAAAHR